MILSLVGIMKKWVIDAEVMKLRGLGYKHKEIAKKLKIDSGVVQYRLTGLKKRTEEEGIDTVFFELLMKLYLPKIMRYLNVR
jgi:hypothetical protein